MADDWKGWTKTEPTKTEMHDWVKSPTLRGVLTDKRENVGTNNSTIYTLETDDTHELVSFWGTTLLDVRLKNLQLGEMVGIAYLGKATSPKTKREYHNFDVYIQPNEEEALIDEVLAK